MVHCVYQKIGQAKAWDHTPEHHRHNKEKAWYDKVKRIEVLPSRGPDKARVGSEDC
jgi:hypothetical protein